MSVLYVRFLNFILRKETAIDFVYYYDKKINANKYYYNAISDGPVNMSLFTQTQMQTQQAVFLDPEMEDEDDHEDTQPTQPMQIEFATQIDSQSLFPTPKGSIQASEVRK